MRKASLDFLQSLADAPSPSGYEQPAARVYRAYTEPLADIVSTDVHGNVTAVLNPGASMRIMLAGHMDELGFIIHHIDSDGQLHFRTIGGHDSAVAIGQRVWIYGKQRLAGVIGRTAIHLQDEAERKKKPEIKDMWIDIGATSRAEAAEIVSLGDVATYQCEFQPLLGDRATARGFDNKMGTFIVAETLRLLKEDGGLHPDVGVYAVATVQEEIGLRGARTASYGIAAQTGVAVDVNHATDYPGSNKVLHGELEVGKGPSVSRGPNINHVAFDLITAAAREAGIPYQVSVSAGGTGTDANAMQLNRAGMATGLLGVPLRYMHTPVELLSLKDVEDCARLMAGYCRQVKPDTDFTPTLIVRGGLLMPDRDHRLRTGRAVARTSLALIYLAAGVLHVVIPAPFLAITPAFVPFPQQVVVLTGLCEIAGAAALLTSRLRYPAGLALALYAVCVYPANLKHAFDPGAVGVIPLGWWYHAPRLAFQPVLVWWALFAGEVVTWPFRRRHDTR